MPRIGRIYIEEGVFHIMARGNNKQPVFHDERDFIVYKKTLLRLKDEQPFKLYHYCLMTNHVHMVIETNEDTKLSKLMKRISLSYYHYYKKRYGYSGHFWQDRFKSLLIEKDPYLLACGLYIERNPIRAKMVSLPEQYMYSSYACYAFGKDDPLLDKDPCYETLGKDDLQRRGEYQKLALADTEQVGKAIGRQLFLGSAGFIKRMEKVFGVSNIRLERGRPKKNK